MAQIGVRKGNVIKLSISISEDSADWIESQVESQRYRNISHAVESVIREKKQTRKRNQCVRSLILSLTLIEIR